MHSFSRKQEFYLIERSKERTQFSNKRRQTFGTTLERADISRQTYGIIKDSLTASDTFMEPKVKVNFP